MKPESWGCHLGSGRRYTSFIYNVDIQLRNETSNAAELLFDTSIDSV